MQPSKPDAPAASSNTNNPTTVKAAVEGKPLAMATTPAPGATNVKPGFYVLELNRTVWVLPECYQNLTPVGTGAYGTVW